METCVVDATVGVEIGGVRVGVGVGVRVGLDPTVGVGVALDHGVGVEVVLDREQPMIATSKLSSISAT